MPGLGINITEENTGYASLSTSTLTGNDATEGPMDKPWSGSAQRPSSRHSSRLRLLSSSSSVDPVASPMASLNVSSPTSLSQFPAAADTISPFCSPPVLLRVGGPQSPSREAQPVSFFVHEKLLTHASTFFRAALSSHGRSHQQHQWFKPSPAPTYSFLEAQTRTISLPEDRPDDVRFLLQWLYQRFCVGFFFPSSSDATGCARRPALQTNQDAPICPTSKPNDCLGRQALLHEGTDDDTITRQLHRYRTYRHQRRLLLPAKRHGDISQLLPPRPEPPAFGPLVRLYILADKYRVGLGLKDLLCDVVRELAAEVNAVPNREDVRLLYENTLGSSPAGGSQSAGMRRLVVDLYVGMKTEKLLAKEDDGWDVGFLRDLVQGMRRREGGGLPSGGGGGLRGRQRDTGAATKKNKKTKNEEEGIASGMDGAALVDGDGGLVDAVGVAAAAAATVAAAEEEGEGKEEMVRVGTLLRRRCDYHDHDHDHDQYSVV